MNSSLKLGSFAEKERLVLMLRDRRAWKAILFSLFAGLSLATTGITIFLIIAIYNIQNIGHAKSHMVNFSLLFLSLSISYPVGTFFEFFCAESQHYTMEEFCSSSIHHDMITIKKLNAAFVLILLPLKLMWSLAICCRKKLIPSAA